MSSWSHYSWALGQTVGDPLAKALLIFIAADTNPLEYRQMAARGDLYEPPMLALRSYFQMMEISQERGEFLIRQLLAGGHLIEHFGYVPAWPEPTPVPRTGQMAPKRRRIFERDSWKCVYCGSLDHLTLDHVQPRSRGGSDLEANLATACRSCNSSKGNRTPAEWRPQMYCDEVL